MKHLIGSQEPFEIYRDWKLIDVEWLNGFRKIAAYRGSGLGDLSSPVVHKDFGTQDPVQRDVALVKVKQKIDEIENTGFENFMLTFTSGPDVTWSGHYITTSFLTKTPTGTYAAVAKNGNKLADYKFTAVSTPINDTTKVWMHGAWSIHQREPWKFKDGTVEYSCFGFDTLNTNRTVVGRSPQSVYDAIKDVINKIDSGDVWNG